MSDVAKLRGSHVSAEMCDALALGVADVYLVGSTAELLAVDRTRFCARWAIPSKTYTDHGMTLR